MRELINQRAPALKSFLRQNKSIVETLLIALMKLASRKSDGKYVSLAEEFDVILEDNVVYQFFSLYKKKSSQDWDTKQLLLFNSSLPS